MVFAGSGLESAPIGLYGGKADRDTLLQGASMLNSLVKSKQEPVPLRKASTSLSLEIGGSRATFVKRTGKRTVADSIYAWKSRRQAEAGAFPIWKDSLVAGMQGANGKTIRVRLANPIAGKRFLGKVLSMKLVFDASPGAEDKVPTQLEVPIDSAAKLVEGGSQVFPVPEGVDSISAILKVYSRETAPPLPNSCMKGLFELRSRKIAISGDSP